MELTSRMADGGPYDLDGVVNGTVRARTSTVLLAAPGASPTGIPTEGASGSQGGGCDGGMSSLLPSLALLGIPVLLWRRR